MGADVMIRGWANGCRCNDFRVSKWL